MIVDSRSCFIAACRTSRRRNFCGLTVSTCKTALNILSLYTFVVESIYYSAINGLTLTRSIMFPAIIWSIVNPLSVLNCGRCS